MVETEKKNFKNKRSNEERAQERKDSILSAYNACNIDGNVTVQELAEYIGVSEKTVRRRLKEHGEFIITDKKISLRDKDKIE